MADNLHAGSNSFYGNYIESIWASDSNAVVNVYENVTVFCYPAKTVVYIFTSINIKTNTKLLTGLLRAEYSALHDLWTIYV